MIAKELYQESGYVSIENIINNGYVFNFLVGGRGTGKTFSSLLYCIEHNIKFIYMRRTQTQADIVGMPEMSPFKAINDVKGHDITVSSIAKNIYGFYHSSSEGKAIGAPVGYLTALTTIKNLRGFDASDVEVIIYDEFIPEAHEKKISNAGDAFVNAYETINRNRELNGFKPVLVLCLANANKIDNELFNYFKLVNIASNMQKKGKAIYTNDLKSLAIYILKDSPISDAKKKTALYNLTNDNDSFNNMALSNTFFEPDQDLIKNIPLKELIPLVIYNQICIYRHKSNNFYFISMHHSGNVEKYDYQNKRKFIRNYQFLFYAYMNNNVYFEDTYSITEFVSIFD